MNEETGFKAQIITAFKQNLIPSLCLQVFALAIAVSYFYWPNSQLVFTIIGDLKRQYGVLFAIVSTAVFGGFIPVSVLCYRQQLAKPVIRHFIFYIVLWGAMGALINWFYHFQSVIFGLESTFLVVVLKTLVDQFIFSVFITCPVLTFLYLWRDCNYRLVKTQSSLNREFFRRKIPLTIVTNWLIWLPAVSLIYTLPIELQIPFFNLVLCFFVLILTFINTDATKTVALSQ